MRIYQSGLNLLPTSKPIAFILFFSLLGIHSAKSNPQITESIFNESDTLNISSIEKIDEAAYNNAVRSGDKDFANDSTVIRKVDGAIILPVRSSKKFRIFIDHNDTNDIGASKTNYYLGYNNYLNSYLIETETYEFMEYYLVPIDGSPEFLIYGIPKISPDKKFIANILDNGLGGMPVGFEVRAISKAGGQFHYTNYCLYQSAWHPLDLTWTEDNAILIKAQPYNENYLEHLLYFKVVLK
jgi:hypothetical protein